jgi:hypothetical protein
MGNILSRQKRLLNILLVVTAVLCLVLPSRAQRNVRHDPAALVALDEAVLPGRAAADLIRDSVAEGQVKLANGQKGTIRISTQGSRRIYYEMTLPDRRLKSVIKDGKGFHFAGGQKKDLPTWVTAYQSVENIPMLSRIQNYTSEDVCIIDLGIKDVAGRSNHEIRIAVQPADERMAATEDLMSELHIFIDTETKQITGTRSFMFSPTAIENRSPVDRVFSDYRLISGIPVPFRIEQYISGELDSIISLTSVRLNVGIADTLFD